MKVLTFSQKVTVSTSHGDYRSQLTCNPGERLIFDNDNAIQIETNQGSAAYILEVSDLEPMLKEIPRPIHYKKRRVLFYRNRGVGDQLIISAIGRFFKEILGADVRQLSDRAHETLWACNPYVGNAPLSVPLHLDAVWRKVGRPFFDAAFFIESATEWENDAEQPNVYDRLYSIVGLDPARIPIKYKRPVFRLHPDDFERRAAWLKSIGGQADLSRGYILTQLRAANKVRSVPAKTAAIVLQAVNDAADKKGIYALISDDRPQSPEIAQAIAQLPRLIDVAGKIPTIRLFGSLIGSAVLVIGPDSSAIHFAASFEVPTIGLWGAFDPACRARYYPNQVHLWHPDLCGNCPCYTYLADLPAHKCPHGAAQTSCEVFEGITYDEVYSAILDALP